MIHEAIDHGGAEGDVTAGSLGPTEEADAHPEEDSLVVPPDVQYDPSSRRRELYDDEDEWEQLVLTEKAKGTQPAGSEGQQSGQSGSDSGQDSGDSAAEGQEEEAAGSDLLITDHDANLAQTQKLLRQRAGGLGEGFQPQVAPLNSILGRLAARQAELEAKAKARAPIAVSAATAAEPVLTMELLKAELAQHNIASMQQSRKQHQQPERGCSATEKDGSRWSPHAAAAAAVGGASGNGGGDAADMLTDLGTFDDDLDDLIVEPLDEQQEQEQGRTSGRACDVPPDSQQLLNELPPLLQRLSTAAAAAAVERPDEMLPPATCQLGGSVGIELDLLLVTEEEEERSGSQEESDEELDSSEADDKQAAQGDSDDLLPEVEPEPLNWEEEEQEFAEAEQQQQQQAGTSSGATAAGAGDQRSRVPKQGVKSRRGAAAGGFIDAEADMSEDEGAVEDGDSDDEEADDADEDLAELIGNDKEGKLDEVQRRALHAEWQDRQEARDLQKVLDGVKGGFRRKRKQAAGLDEEAEDGTDATARRRRAQLLGTLDDGDDEEDEEAGAQQAARLQRLDYCWTEDKQNADEAVAAAAAELAAKQKRQKIQQLQQQASESQPEADVMQLLQMDVDEDSQHIAAMLSRSASAAVAVLGHTNSGSLAAAPGIGSNSAAGGSNLRHVSGPGNSKGAAAGGFHFQMFGQDVTNNSTSRPAPSKATGSFIGRQASTSIAVRAGSNYGASRSFVFGKGPAGAGEAGPHGLMQKQHLDAAVGVSFRMANGGRADNSNAAVSSHGPWQF
eukprot:gene2800-3093_t